MVTLLKKLWPVWVIVGALVLILGIPTTVSYLRGGRRAAQDFVKDLTPIEFDLKRLDGEIDNLVPQIRAARQVVAEMDVAIASQEKAIDELHQKQNEARAQMKKLRDLLEENKKEYEIAGRRYTHQEVEQDLTRRLDQYEQNQATIKTQEALLAQQKESFETAQSRLTTLVSTKDRLLAQTQALKQQLEAVRLAQKTSNVVVDTSAISRAEELVKQIDQRIQVLGKSIQLEERDTLGIPVEADARSAAERYDATFEKQSRY